MKVAFVTPIEILGPENNGGVQCSNRNLSLLRQICGEQNVYVCAVTANEEYLSKANENTAVFFLDSSKEIYTLRRALSGRWSFDRKTESAIIKHIIELGCEIVFIDYSLVGFIPKRLPDNIKQILFMQNIEREYVKSLRRNKLRLLLRQIPSMLNEKTAVKNADVIISLNKRDAQLLQKYYGRSPDIIMPITFNDSFVQQEEKHKCSDSQLQLLFVGSLFPPNEHGVTWFADNVMPHVNAEFTIVGKGFEKLAERLSGDKIKVIGTVDDVSQYYYCADATVMPVYYGGGMKVKTAEALMYGKPMFATDEALEGYEVDDLKNIHRCNSPDEFISSINAYAEKQPYISFDNEIRKLFLEKYHTPAYTTVLREILS